jgi:hypothetical protein
MGVDLLAEFQDMLMPGPLGGAVHIPGDGRCRKRLSDRARHVRRQTEGCEVYSFKARASENLDHDYLWRCLKCLPERGRIGIFNRSCSWKLAGASPSGAVRGGLCVCHTGYRVPTPGFDSGRRFRPGFRRPAREHESLGAAIL